MLHVESTRLISGLFIWIYLKNALLEIFCHSAIINCHVWNRYIFSYFVSGTTGLLFRDWHVQALNMKTSSRLSFRIAVGGSWLRSVRFELSTVFILINQVLLAFIWYCKPGTTDLTSRILTISDIQTEVWFWNVYKFEEFWSVSGLRPRFSDMYRYVSVCQPFDFLNLFLFQARVS